MVLAADYSRDGTKVATAASDKTARIWDAQTGALLSALQGHERAVTFIVVSPDSTRVITASTDKTARLGRKYPALLVTLLGHDRAVTRAESARTAAARS